MGADDFLGEYRKGPKTSIVRKNGKIAVAEKYTDLVKLIKSLVPDAKMRAKYGKLIVRAGDKAAAVAAPNTRVPEEKRNVQVDCWIQVAKHEKDNDYHTIICSSPQASQGKCLNSEFAGLPPPGPDRTDLDKARKQLKKLAGKKPPSSQYLKFAPPRKVRITGSLFFDADHKPGQIGPAGLKPQTVWEIHPVISISKL